LDGGDAAGDDVAEAFEGFGGNVDGEAVHADPVADTDADGRDFFFADPCAREAVAAGGRDTEGRAKGDKDILQEAEVEVEVAPEGVQV